MLFRTVKYLLFIFIMISTSSQAGLVNAISVTVNKEPITLYEIHKLSNVESISLHEALENLVEQRLEDSQIKKLGIDVDSFEVQTRLEGIAAQNNISVNELKNFISSKGMDWSSYKSDLEKVLKQEKLYRRIFSNALSSIEEQDIRRYYENNPNEFKRATQLKLVRYESKNENSLNRVLSSPMSIVEGVEITPELIQASTLDGRTRYYIDETSIGAFTPLIKTDEGAKMYLVEDKAKYETLSFEMVKNAIASKLEEEKRQAAIKNYFEKLKSSADIVVIRRP